ncbi:aminotransferase class I/II-fold pyridoxal phosphate-dependent enzyme [Galbibacter sp.]|jgi:7-keto-8-aminopelargonate synthetase-like enzyme|uniref:aminotransferase class I/II-fold pyridoxal phosphate-dependent enzyme n=1 Tax=Galbibacter sp. TaxID=2918471 RepID=UPI003A8FEA3B
MEHYMDKFPSRVVQTDKGEYRYFGGTAYLGLQTRKDFIEHYTTNIIHYGTHYGASRASNVRFSIYDKAEQYLARYIGSESCLSLSSGYMASQLVSQYFSVTEHIVYRTPYSHDSLAAAGQLKVKDYEELKDALKRKRQEQKAVILLDSIDFMGLNYPDFKGLQSLNLQDCIVVVDDSHGLGVVGPKGAGVFNRLLQLPLGELIVCGSLGKGFGLQLGGVFGTKKRIEELRQTPIFGGSSPASPATLATLMESQYILERQREKLRSNLKQFCSLVKKPELFIHLGDHPTFTFMDEQLTTHLYDNRIIVTSFPYPTKESQLMSRIVISAFHTPRDIETLAEVINEY